MDFLPGFDADVKSNGSDGASDGGGAVDDGPVVPMVRDEVWKRLCAAALRIREREPWKTLHDSELIGIRHPESGEVMLLSVLGGERNVFAVHLHLGAEGQRFWRNTLEAGMADESLLPYGLRMVECEWQNKSQCEAEDIEIWQRHGKASRKRHWWPQFRSWLPGYSPWFVDDNEARLLSIGLELLNRLFDEAEQKNHAVSSQFADLGVRGVPDWIPLYELKESGQADRCDDWRLTRADLPDPGPPPPAEEPEDELFAARLAHLPVVDGVWEIGAAWQPTPVFEPGEDRPFFPKTAICVGPQIGSPPAPELYGGKTTDAEALRKVFAALAEAEGYLPSEIRVSSDKAEAALRSVAACTKMRITREPLEMVPSLLGTMSDIASGDSPLNELLDLLPPDATAEMIADALSAIMHESPAGGGGVGPFDPDFAARLRALNLGDPLSEHDDDGDVQLPVPTGEERYTLRISLRYSQPEIWRRITIAADATFYHLHDAIQTVMPWEDSHLYEFVIGDTRKAPRVGAEPDCDYPVATTRLIDVLGARKKKFSYIYDFGDDWDHEILVEKKTRESKPDPQTHVIDGEGVAPPEDCGGLGGFYGLISGDPDWCEDWDEADLERLRSGRFNPKKVRFCPVGQLRYLPRPFF